MRTKQAWPHWQLLYRQSQEVRCAVKSSLLRVRELEQEPHTGHECWGIDLLSYAPREIRCLADFPFPNEADVGRELTRYLVAEPQAKLNLA